ncbi:hypothetical protein [Streptomyces viridochromogenes]|uniref:hypothetical protein n=1 Tax=Streptomyces viridochromogenes TaxID=1938 RepID=UPI00131A2596|nr:hypothetical protein [Streptomyces viridochromogenes]
MTWSAALPGAALRMLRTAAGRRALQVVLLVGGVLVIGLLCGERASAAEGVRGLTDSAVGRVVTDQRSPARPDAHAPIGRRGPADVRPVSERAGRGHSLEAVGQRGVRVVGDAGEAAGRGLGEARTKEPSSPSPSQLPEPPTRPAPSDPPPPNVPVLSDPPVPPKLPALPDPQVLPDPPVLPELPVLSDPQVLPKLPVLSDPPLLPKLPALPDPQVLPDPPVLPELPVLSDPQVLPKLPVLSDPPLLPKLPALPDPQVLPDPPVLPKLPVLSDPPVLPKLPSLVELPALSGLLPAPPTAEAPHQGEPPAPGRLDLPAVPLPTPVTYDPAPGRVTTPSADVPASADPAATAVECADAGTEATAHGDVHRPARAGGAYLVNLSHRDRRARNAAPSADPSAAHSAHAPGAPAHPDRPDGTLGNRATVDNGAPRHGDAHAVTLSLRVPLRLVPDAAARSHAAGTRDSHRDIPLFPG